MSDKIILRDLEVHAHIGAHQDERSTAQPILVSIELDTDLALAVSSDDLIDTIDYAAVVSAVAERASSRPFVLLESLAGEIASDLVAISLVSEVTVEVGKKNVPVGHAVGGVSVRLTRGGKQ